MNSATIRTMLAATSFAVLTACGGGSTDNGAGANSDQTLGALFSSESADPSATVNATASKVRMGGTTDVAAVTTPEQASRFLAQASFGPTNGLINSVVSSGPSAWLEAQLNFGAAPTYRSYIESLQAAGQPAGQGQFNEFFWKRVMEGNDQLRQRVTFALSQIFVVSFEDATLAEQTRGMADYYDMLGKNSLGNFRQLLESVTLHPMMGIYLSSIHNQKESGNRLPDENFAREVMQLMTIGLQKLNQDGTPILVNGAPVETYTHDDIMGMAKVMTGWSFSNSDKLASRFIGTVKDPDWAIKPMTMYSAFHSTSDKTFLGTTIRGTTTGEADLKVALDTLFNHPNVGPFIGRQLIQHLVTSNPSPAYVSRVAAAFANNGAGVRGDMKAVIRAVLMDTEARNIGADSGKVREPVLRLANWMRAFNATSTSTRYLIPSLYDPIYGLGQSPLRAPSVFNFFRPGYVPPESEVGAANMVAPEMQITAEPSVIGYLNYMQNAVSVGVGTNLDVKPNYQNELVLVDNPGKLVDRINLLLLNGNMSSTLRSQIINAVNSIERPVPTSSNAALVARLAGYRVQMAIFLAMASPDYIVQK
ncbi:DUF1800 family protein [Pseudoduganella sp. FT26W]|uniref:DUF1800 family protein n=1 Tax=Duganella aquatilis TaxID=2666082 RepID=A0A844D5U0_9BURK|nr:DUF1800 domain-containing protein [Duganella aquatilis]MRW86271.1 DUF1800 family protein [Duganella aquatilis]